MVLGQHIKLYVILNMIKGSGRVQARDFQALTKLISNLVKKKNWQNIIKSTIAGLAWPGLKEHGFNCQQSNKFEKVSQKNPNHKCQSVLKNYKKRELK